MCVDQAKLNRCIHQSLRVLLEKECFYADDVKSVTGEYYRAVMQTMVDDGIVDPNYDSILANNNIDKQKARKLYDSLYYAKQADHFEQIKKRDEFMERSTKSAEESAIASKESAASAKEANRIATVSNNKARTANWVAGISAFFTFMTWLYYILSHFKLI